MGAANGHYHATHPHIVNALWEFFPLSRKISHDIASDCYRDWCTWLIIWWVNTDTSSILTLLRPSSRIFKLRKSLGRLKKSLSNSVNYCCCFKFFIHSFFIAWVMQIFKVQRLPYFISSSQLCINNETLLLTHKIVLHLLRNSNNSINNAIASAINERLDTFYPKNMLFSVNSSEPCKPSY